jgi:hypothetical protein
MSALPPKADIAGRQLDVRFVPRLDRRLPAQHFVEGRPYQRWLLAQRLPLPRTGGEGSRVVKVSR